MILPDKKLKLILNFNYVRNIYILYISESENEGTVLRTKNLFRNTDVNCGTRHPREGGYLF